MTLQTPNFFTYKKANNMNLNYAPPHTRFLNQTEVEELFAFLRQKYAILTGQM